VYISLIDIVISTEISKISLISI